MTEAAAQSFVTKSIAAWTAGISGDFHTVRYENGTVHRPMSHPS
jgi:hypothetical protein